MTSPISSYSQSQGLSDPIGLAAGAPAGAAPGASSLSTPAGSPSGAVSSGEAVTLTPDARTSTDLLEAARAAAGVDDQAVQSLKAEIMSGAYQVPSKSLAASIVAAFMEMRS